MEIFIVYFFMKFRSVHPWHLVELSPWPILMSFAVFTFSVSLVNFFSKLVSPTNLLLPLIVILLIGVQWFRDIIREAHGGYHTKDVQRSIYLGFI